MISDWIGGSSGLISLTIAILGIVGLYKAFEKADKPGLIALIPILNVLNLIDMAGRPMWWGLLLLIPGVNVIVAIIITQGIAKRFDKGWLFGLGLLLLGPICWMILGFGGSRYRALRA